MLAISLVAMLMFTTAAPALANDHDDRDDRRDRWEDNRWDWDNRWHSDNDWDWDDRDDWDWDSDPFNNVIDDVEYENVSGSSWLEGNCYPEDVDFDGWIAEWEIVCYY